MRLYFIGLMVCSACSLHAQTPVYGEAIIYTYDLSGNRTLRTYNSNTTINYKHGSTSSIDTVFEKELSGKADFTVFPNPTTDKIIVKNHGWVNTDRAVIQVYDINGKFISAKDVSTADTDVYLGNLAASTYVINYHLNGIFSKSWRVIKK